MEHYSDDKWQEGRNLKAEQSKKVKSKRRKAKSIQRGIDDYFLSEDNPDLDCSDDHDMSGDSSYH